VQLSVIIKTPRETDFVLDIPISSPTWWKYSWPSLHDVSPLKYYSNFTRLDMEQFEWPEFDSYKSVHEKFTPSLKGNDALSYLAYFFNRYLLSAM